LQRIIIFTYILFITCQNPFKTREAEEPSQQRTNREIPSDPETVLRNLQSAIVDMNVDNYMLCLLSAEKGFQFIPDPFVKENYPTLFELWTDQSERSYFSQLATYLPGDSLSRLILEVVSTEVFQDSALLRRKYELFLDHTYSGNVPKAANGQADFWLVQDEGYWYIKRWIDIGTSDTPCWSTIKAGFGK